MRITGRLKARVVSILTQVILGGFESDTDAIATALENLADELRAQSKPRI